jgi:hypothetical protein
VYFWVYGFRKGQSSTPFCGERERGGGGQVVGSETLSALMARGRG